MERRSVIEPLNGSQQPRGIDRGWRSLALAGRRSAWISVAIFTLILACLPIVNSSVGISALVNTELDPLPLGTLTTTSHEDSSCPAGHTCQAFDVICPMLQDSRSGFLAKAEPTVQTRGVVVLASGGHGTAYWAKSSTSEALIQDLQNEGFLVVQFRWTKSWLKSKKAEEAGPARVACRPATVVRWVYDNYYSPLGIDPALGECGFCISGNSGGSSQVSYPLSHFGLDSILDAVVPTAGPAHAALSKGCLRVSGEEDYWFDWGESANIDGSYGYGEGGPCAVNDATWTSRWDEDSLDALDRDQYHASTRVHVIFGDDDYKRTVSWFHATDYIDRLIGAGSPYVTLEIVRAGHTIHDYPDGAAAIKAALLASASAPTPSVASPTLTSVPEDYSSSDVTFSFTHPDPLVSFRCWLDDQAEEACTSPFSYSGLADGNHTFNVIAVDANGNTSSPASHTWWVGTDDSPPTVTMKKPRGYDLLKSVDVRALWTATDDTEVVQYDLYERIGLTGVQSLIQSSDATSYGHTGTPGATYCYQVYAFDGAGNVGSGEETCAAVPYNDTDPSISYAGDVSRVIGSKAYQGDLTVLDGPGESAEITCTCQKVGVLARQDPASGDAHVWVDGVLLKTISLYASTTIEKTYVVSIPLSGGTHTVKVEWAGTKSPSSSDTLVYIDGFAVIGP